MQIVKFTEKSVKQSVYKRYHLPKPVPVSASIHHGDLQLYISSEYTLAAAVRQTQSALPYLILFPHLFNLFTSSLYVTELYISI